MANRESRTQVVIAGAGFAGITLAKRLCRGPFDILLIDKLNHHQFQPLFYQVAASQLEPASISFPLRNVFRSRKNVHIRLATIERIDPVRKIVHTSAGSFPYQVLVLALGCTTNFYGNAELARHAYTLKSTTEAITLRNHVLQTFEDIIAADPAERAPLMNLVVVGGGPTGVELAGAFAEIRRHVLPRDYPDIDFSGFSIILVEGGPATLGAMSETAQQTSARYLEQMGVRLITGTVVKSYDGTTLALGNGETLVTRTVIWAAGVTAEKIQGLPDSVYTQGNRIAVDRTNRVAGCEGVYVLGDLCRMETPNYPKGHPQLARVAINQAKLLAKNLRRMQQNEPAKLFEYHDPGTMATIGRNKAVVDMGKFHLTGYFAWLAWMVLHLMFILTVKNRIIIFINWAWAYLTFDSSLRLILRQKENKN